MIAFIKPVSKHATLGVWHITESIQELEDMVNKTELEESYHYTPRRKKEYLSSRVLVTKVLASLDVDYFGIRKDKNGKPFLDGYDWHLSITHSHDFSGCLIHKKSPCGMDIERPREQLFKIKEKYLSPNELVRYGSDLVDLTKAWAAKEAIYKIYGQKAVHFSKQIQIIKMGEKCIRGCLNLGHTCKTFQLLVEQLDENFLVYSA